eukprot:761440-Alexandrium_andersonii.AAC.1
MRATRRSDPLVLVAQPSYQGRAHGGLPARPPRAGEAKCHQKRREPARGPGGSCAGASEQTRPRPAPSRGQAASRR